MNDVDALVEAFENLTPTGLKPWAPFTRPMPDL